MPRSTARPPRITSPTFCTTPTSRSQGLPTACRSAANSTISTKARWPPRCGSARCFRTAIERGPMTGRDFAKRCAMAGAVVALALTAPIDARAQQAEPAKPGKLINAGDILSGQLNAMRLRGGKKGKRVSTFQLVSEPRRLPPPNGLCNLETGPETFQIVTSSDAQAAQLKGLIGKQVSVKVDEVACAQDPGVMSEAIVTKWSVVKQ